ncbi:hypothetical protein [Ensifer sp. 22564]|uniref:hypothetical protein n=1 Tax=Ensifer sp. 22564 TaxID=3453943 RepID=UPI003F83E39A
MKEASAEVVAVPFGDPQIFRQIGLIERRTTPRAAVIESFINILSTSVGSLGFRGERSSAAHASALAPKRGTN